MFKGNGSQTGQITGQKLVAVIPAFNEERFIGSVVLKTRQHTDQVIVVDDGSTDHTTEIATAAGATVIQHEENQGKGVALNTGFQAAYDTGADVVVTFDADGQHLPEEMVGVIFPVCNGDADLVVGSRYVGNSSRVPRHRIWGHKVFNTLTNLLSGVPLTDSQSGFRAFSRQALEMLSFNSTGFSVESEMQLLANQHGLTMKEVPITIRYEDKPKRPVWRHGLLVLNGILRLVGQYRPLLFFGLSGLILMLTGGVLGAYVVNIYSRIQELAVGYALISVFLVIIGAISFSTGIILHSVRGLLFEMDQRWRVKSKAKA